MWWLKDSLQLGAVKYILKPKFLLPKALLHLTATHLPLYICLRGLGTSVSHPSPDVTRSKISIFPFLGYALAMRGNIWAGHEKAESTNTHCYCLLAGPGGSEMLHKKGALMYQLSYSSLQSDGALGREGVGKRWLFCLFMGQWSSVLRVDCKGRLYP